MKLESLLRKTLIDDAQDNAALVSKVIDMAYPKITNISIKVTVKSIDADLVSLKMRQSETKTDENTLSGSVTDLLDFGSLPNGGFTLPVDGDNGKEFIINIKPLQLRHQRYLQLEAVAGDGAVGTEILAEAVMEYSGEHDIDATGLGVDHIINIPGDNVDLS